jgi:hypothetical protein
MFQFPWCRNWKTLFPILLMTDRAACFAGVSSMDVVSRRSP